MVFLMIFWTAYIPIAVVLLALVGNFVMRSCRKLRQQWSLASLHRQERFHRPAPCPIPVASRKTPPVLR
jgi:hypothetical protein